jgi:hypothetical protein
MGKKKISTETEHNIHTAKTSFTVSQGLPSSCYPSSFGRASYPVIFSHIDRLAIDTENKKKLGWYGAQKRATNNVFFLWMLTTDNVAILLHHTGC